MYITIVQCWLNMIIPVCKMIVCMQMVELQVIVKRNWIVVRRHSHFGQCHLWVTFMKTAVSTGQTTTPSLVRSHSPLVILLLMTRHWYRLLLLAVYHDATIASNRQNWPIELSSTAYVFIIAMFIVIFHRVNWHHLFVL